MSDKSWYRFERNADGPTEIFLYGEIGGGGITANEFVQELRGVDAASLKVRINSPGGLVDDGLAIIHALNEFEGYIETHGDAAVYSIASVIMQAGDKRRMAPKARMMVHEAMAFGLGYAEDMERLSVHLRETTQMIAGIYAERSGKEAAYWLTKMKAETRMDGKTTVDEGLADELSEENDRAAFRIAANFNLTRFRYSAALKAELEQVAGDLGIEPLQIPTDHIEDLETALEAANAALKAIRESNKAPSPAPNPRAAARRELDAAIARVKL